MTQKVDSMRFFQKISLAMRRFMTGRYGTDKLNMALLSVGLVLCLLSMLFRRFAPWVSFGMTLLSYAIMIWCIFRCFSRNTYKRYRENRKYLQFLERIKDRDHRYYNCPRCRQPVRVPKGKGKIAITCPRCKEKFIKKT